MTTQLTFGQWQRAVVWRNIRFGGTDCCSYSDAPNGTLLKGLATFSLDEQPVAVEYDVFCDRSWRTHSVSVRQRYRGESRDMTVILDESRRWWVNGEEHAGIRGCSDIDISATPATNTIPVRRLALQVGETAEVVGAWLRCPEFTIEPLQQRYTRMSPGCYKYESSTGFSTELQVDDLGLIVNYPDIWERVFVV